MIADIKERGGALFFTEMLDFNLKVIKTTTKLVE